MALAACRAGHARRLWENWYQRAMESGIGPLVQFANCLKPYLNRILAHCRHPLHARVLEGINNQYRLIKRMAYEFYRDEDYFFLKISAALPAKLR